MLTTSEKLKLKDILLAVKEIRINAAETFSISEDERVLRISMLALKIDLAIGELIKKDPSEDV